MIRAFGILKKAACTTNLELKTLDPKIGELIMVLHTLLHTPTAARAHTHADTQAHSGIPSISITFS